MLAWPWAELYLAPAPSADEVVLPDLFRHRILLLGNPASRPEGLERVLVRGGFQVTETPSVSPPDFILYTPDPGARNLADDVRALATQSTYGCEIVCPFPIGRGASLYASPARWGGKNHSRGAQRIAASTR